MQTCGVSESCSTQCSEARFRSKLRTWKNFTCSLKRANTSFRSSCLTKAKTSYANCWSWTRLTDYQFLKYWLIRGSKKTKKRKKKARLTKLTLLLASRCLETSARARLLALYKTPKTPELTSTWLTSTIYFETNGLINTKPSYRTTTTAHWHKTTTHTVSTKTRWR